MRRISSHINPHNTFFLRAIIVVMVPLAGVETRADMKKSTLRIVEQQPRNIQRADIAPETGYSMVVDGHFKTHFSQESAAKKAATELLARYPMLQVEIYDAGAKTRTRVQGKAFADSET